MVKREFYRAQAPLWLPRTPSWQSIDGPEKKQPDDDGAQSHEAKLAIAQLHQLPESAPPAGWREKGQQAFHHQDERERAPENIRTHGGLRDQRRCVLLAEVPEPRRAWKKSEDAGSITSTSLFLLKLCL